MAFLRNAWYCAAWPEEVGIAPLGRTFLDEPVVLFRKSDGAVVALADRCPHRFAPLHMGKVVKGDCIQCPYHGLEFGPDGVCSHNPHGEGAIPKAAHVRSYPVLERQGVVWIWMGDPALADADRVVDLGDTESRPGWTAVQDTLQVRANYELVADNLLDLSHVPYLHAFLSFGETPPAGFREVRELKQEGDTVWSMHWNYRAPLAPLFRLLWGDDAPAHATMRAHMRWNAPGVLHLDTGVSPEGGPGSAGASAPICHLLTPETEHSTHYFWRMARNRHLDDDAVSSSIKENVGRAFREEDEPMIEACARMMGTTDLMSLKPVLLPGDAPAVRARRILAGMIEKERAEAAHGP